MSLNWSEPGFVFPEMRGDIRDHIEQGTHFRVSGQGPTVMLIHGVGLDLTMWDDISDELSKEYTVIRYDLLGHGESAKPSIQGLKSFVDQLEYLVNYFKLQKFALVGFSLGSLIARAYAVDYSDRLAALVVMSGVYNRTEDEMRNIELRVDEAEQLGSTRMIPAALKRWFSAEYYSANTDRIEALRKRLLNNDSAGFMAGYKVFASREAELRGTLDEINCPTLVCTGALDPGSNPRQSEEMAMGIAGAECVIWPELRHMAPWEGHSIVTKTLSGFFTKQR